MQVSCSESRMIKEVLPFDHAGGGDDHQEDLDAQVEEEAVVARPLPAPQMPMRSKFEDHRLTHVPHRTWCNHCVEGRGRKAGHSRQGNEGRRVSTISVDYAFVADRGEITSQEQADVEEGSVKIRRSSGMLSRRRASRTRALPSTPSWATSSGWGAPRLC